MGASLFDKIWDSHVVTDLGDGYALIFVDRHVVHDLGGRGFVSLNERGLPLRHPELTFATPDHTIATLGNAGVDPTASRNPFAANLRENARRFGFRLFDVTQPEFGIVHIITPELGLALPGTTLACGDSHSCTIGALGAIAWGIGQSELVHVLATQTSVQRRPRTFRVTLGGGLAEGVTPKDVILHLIGRLGADAGTGHAVEFAGPAIRTMAMEGRLTICNMAVEMGAQFGLIAPDDVTFAYLEGRPYTPRGALWDAALADWRALPSDDDAEFDREVRVDCSDLAPQITWGTSPQDVIAIDASIPDPSAVEDPQRRRTMATALDYIDLPPGQPIAGTPVDWVFVGSCTNSRISDLRAAAAVARGRRVAEHVTAWVVPGSRAVQAQAEAEGLDTVFRQAGFSWGSPGCSMCGGAGDEMREKLPAGSRAVSTTNRNFVGRQGPGSRTHLASPAMAVAAAVTGRITDVRTLIAGA